MTIARRKQVCLDITPVYHCIIRCVRRSLLCGYDKLTRRNYDHRRAWIEDRLLLLAEVFCIEIAGYSIKLVQHYYAGEVLTGEEQKLLKSIVARWRDNLSNISRFMGNLNEYIARKANKEDGCTGAFWESRFKLQAVLDVAALLQTLCYVDLNPVRAKMAKTPEDPGRLEVHVGTSSLGSPS